MTTERGSDVPESSERFRCVPWAAIGMGIALFVVHLVVNRQYGFHGDELYFIVCGQRPAWGYVDHPPYVPMIARFATDVFGMNLFALRLFPAVALGVSCILTGWLARRLGAGLYGEFLASLSFVCAPMMLRFGSILNIPSFEVLFWLMVAHTIVTLCRRNDPRWWLVVGVLSGVALLNKHTTLFLGTGIAVGLVLTPRQRDLATPWPWVGGAVAMAIVVPNLVWQYHHDWATLEFVREINANIMQHTPRLEFVAEQFVFLNVFGSVVWIAGLVFFLKHRDGCPYRILGWVFMADLAIMLVFKAKIYYLAPAYPMLMAGGGVLLERYLVGPRMRYARVALPLAIAAMGLVFVPIACPVGSIEWKERYITRVLGFLVDDPRDLTFDFRYQRGRVEQIEAFSIVYESLDAGCRKACVILTDEYDTASAVNVLGRDMGLPQAIGGNNSYYLWGPQGATGECVIAYGYDEAFLRTCFREVRVVGEAVSPWYLESAGVRPIYVCRMPVAPLAEMWPRFKRYY